MGKIRSKVQEVGQLINEYELKSKLLISNNGNVYELALNEQILSIYKRDKVKYESWLINTHQYKDIHVVMKSKKPKNRVETEIADARSYARKYEADIGTMEKFLIDPVEITRHKVNLMFLRGY